ncbi:MAG: RagB/SusD family nutrient uptake outer membrane protein [Bergeyella cardium]|uniref:RagB/SusD family nutrient uptake outer membrane protein n=1 Tax=Bergeyella cardium TaxID=1585976 RepID=UPI000EA181FA|nr:RagB/SusD family nutrient uptake outer membrane protein [Bergeyella cardium]
MKITKYIIGLLAVAMTLQSCREEYLNEPQPRDAVIEETVYSTVENAMAHITGTLRLMRASFYDDAYYLAYTNLASVYYARTVKGNDFILNSTDFFTRDYNYTGIDAINARPTFTWDYFYQLINQTNALVNGISKSTTITEAEKKPLLAQALAMRALFYFELSMEFQTTYSYDTSLFAPPIYKEANTTQGLPMSSQKEMYDFIVSDIEKAIDYGSYDRIDKSYFNKQVAYAIAARIYQVMAGNTKNAAYWTKARDYAKLAYNSNIVTALDADAYALGFDSATENKEWILGIIQKPDQTVTWKTAPSSFLASPWYDTAWANESFVAQFADGDVRKLFYDYNFYGTTKQRTSKFTYSDAVDVTLIRTAEMILIEAEAEYNLGNESTAHALLFQLQKNRYPNAVQSSNTGAALLEEILLERRKELYAEMGVEWYDAKRLQRGITRDANHPTALTLQPNDKKFYLDIPQSEINANDNIPNNINDRRKK